MNRDLITTRTKVTRRGVTRAALSSFGFGSLRGYGVSGLTAFLFLGLAVRLVAAVVTWDGGGDGRRWRDPANWDGDRLPAAADDVVIPERAGAIDHESGTTTIRSVVAPGGLRWIGGTFAVTGGESRLGGTVRLQNGATLTGRGTGVVLVLEGTPADWSGDVVAEGGANLRLSGLRAVRGGGMTWRAQGTGSRIDAGSVTNLVLEPTGYLSVQALGGGEVILSGLARLHGPLRGRAANDGLLDLGGVRGSWTTEGFTYGGELLATLGGRIRIPGIADLARVTVELDDTGDVSTSQMRSLAGGTLRVRGPREFDFGNLTNLDDTGLDARDGAVLRLNALQSLRGQSMNWLVRGGGSRLDAGSLTNLTLSQSGYLVVDAQLDGRVELGGLRSLRGPVQFTARDRGVIDLSGVSGRWSSAGFTYTQELIASRGGRILIPGVTELERATLDTDSADAIPTAQLTRFERGILRARGAALPNFSSLVLVDETNVEALEGAVVRCPRVENLRLANASWRAVGPGSLIDARTIVGLTLPPTGYWTLQALTDGRIDLGGIGTLRGALQVQVRDGGVVDLSGARGLWSGDGFTYPGELVASRGGRILIPGVTRLERVTVDLDADEAITTTTWTSSTRGILRVRGGGRPGFPLLAEIDDTDLYALEGAFLDLPAVRQVRGQSMTWQAQGTGSRLDLRGLVQLIVPMNGYLGINALVDGGVDLRGLPSLEGAIQVTARDGGWVDLRGVRGSWTSDGWIYRQELNVLRGGQVHLAGLTGFDRGEINLGPEGFFPTDQLVGLTHSTVTLDQVTANFGSLRDQTGTEFNLRNGGRAVFSGGPRIIQPPVVQSARLGGSLEYSVLAEGEAPLTFQWRKNGQNLPGEFDAHLRLENLKVEDAGEYSVLVRNSAGVLESVPVQLSLDLPSLPFADRFAERGRLTDSDGAGSGSSRMATREPGEPLHAGKAGARSLWISWRPSQSGVARFRTSGSSFDTLLAVYTGESLNGLTEVTGDEDRGGFLTSEVRFNALAGTEYQVAIDGYVGAAGEVVLSWELIQGALALPEIVRQPASVLALSGSSAEFQVETTTENATYQWFRNGVPLPGETSATLVIPRVNRLNSGAYRVRVSSLTGLSTDSADAQLEGFDRVEAAGTLSADKLEDLFSAAEWLPEFAAARGLHGFPVLDLSPGANRAGPPPAVGLPGEQWTDNGGSTRGPRDPVACGFAGSSTRWFRIRFRVPGGRPTPVRLAATGVGVAPVMAVFTNRFDLRLLGCDAAAPPAKPEAEAWILAQRDEDYLVMLDGVDGAQGPIALNWQGDETVAPPTTALVQDRLFIQLIVPSGTYTLDQGTSLAPWVNLLRTNVTRGVFQYHDPDPAVDPARFFRLVPGS